MNWKEICDSIESRLEEHLDGMEIVSEIGTQNRDSFACAHSLHADEEETIYEELQWLNEEIGHSGGDFDDNNDPEPGTEPDTEPDTEPSTDSGTDSGTVSGTESHLGRGRSFPPHLNDDTDYMGDWGDETEDESEVPIVIGINSVVDGWLMDLLALPSDTVSEVKSALFQSVGILGTEYHLMLRHRKLNDFDVLRDVGVLDSTQLTIVPRLRSATW